MAEPVRTESACPTCGGIGPDVLDCVGDYGGDTFEARCGDEWHDDQPNRINVEDTGYRGGGLMGRRDA